MRPATKKIAVLGLCTAVALILAYVESMLPPLFHAVPGIKIGLPIKGSRSGILDPYAGGIFYVREYDGPCLQFSGGIFKHAGYGAAKTAEYFVCSGGQRGRRRVS